MCGRYELEAVKRDLWERYQLAPEGEVFSPRTEIFPTNTCPVIISGPKLTELKWGFTESFAKKPLINARAETVLQKPTFRDSFIHSRCLIPATGFFEWEKTGTTKTKRRISVDGLPIFSMAGIRKIYSQADGTTLETFSILTTEAAPSVEKIHDRMPVILLPEEEALYLDHQRPVSEIHGLLKPFDSLVIK